MLHESILCLYCARANMFPALLKFLGLLALSCLYTFVTPHVCVCYLSVHVCAAFGMFVPLRTRHCRTSYTIRGT